MVLDAALTGSLWIPMGLWFLNVLIRLKGQFQISSGADWFLLLVAFDLSAILAASDFSQFVQYEHWVGVFPSLMLGLAFMATLGWVLSALYIEPVLANRGNSGGQMTFQGRLRLLRENPHLIYRNKLSCSIIAVLLLVVITAMHLHVFTYRGA